MTVSNNLNDYLERATARLKEIREGAGLKQKEFAEMFDINPTTYNRYESGGINKMPHSLLEKICLKFGINQSWLAGFPDIEKYMDVEKVYQDSKRIPLLGSIAAGVPVLAQQELIGYELIYENMNCDFCLKVKGDSMINARIYDGDIVFIRSQPEIEHGEIAAVIIDNEDATLKRVFKINGSIILHAENPKYQDIVISKKDLKQVKIIGKCIAVKFNLEV